ncbi:unnamed protein product [Paramecium pentaurelia]|uniref:Uncharacterized protein n=1 Tax=Paramecium pentaurelia TaxID=43138 RepID=A0A8S1U4Z7_9CILI|nr:unnamed protein product [Paramecium pentaurelia]
MLKTNSYHLKTNKKQKSSPLTSQELLQKLLDFKQTQTTMNCSYENKTLVMSGNLAKKISKSISIGSRSWKDIVPHLHESDNCLKQKEEIVNTLKRSKHVRHISQIWSMRNRTDSNYHTPRKEGVNDFIQNARIFLKEKLLENKLDKLCYQVQQLKNKSDILELQNKLLFENLKQHHNEHNNMQERKVLMGKLDQMITMQKKQEQSINYFKQLFKDNDDEGRRVKTQTSYPKLRPVLYSGYIGLKI